jgi:hypothetical protein
MVLLIPTKCDFDKSDKVENVYAGWKGSFIITTG